MRKYTLLDELRDFVAKIAWKIFLWSIKMTEEQYWQSVAIFENQKEFDIKDEFFMLFEEAQRREIDNEYPKAWKNAMVMLHMYIKTGKSNFGKQK